MPLEHDILMTAERAARDFLGAVEAMRTRHARDDYFRRMHDITGFKETAAVRRSSMSLTRALAQVRRSK